MHSREINPPDEILRRLLYIGYIAAWTTAAVLLLLGLVQGRMAFLGSALLLGLFCLLLKNFGERRLQFKRLARSFPFGDPADELPEEVRIEAEALFQILAHEGLDWQQRHDVRGKLTRLVEESPWLLDLYRAEFEAYAPTLRARAVPPSSPPA